MTSRLVKTLKFISLAIGLSLALGCSGEDPNPEMKDPIYGDLQKEHTKHVKMLEDAQKSLDTIKAELDAVEPRSLDRKIKSREYQKGLKAITQISEKTQYYKIKAQLRKAYGRKAYKVAYQKGETWPNPKEFDDYNTNKRLREAPRSWSHRVPKSSHQQISEEDMKKGSEK